MYTFVLLLDTAFATKTEMANRALKQLEEPKYSEDGTCEYRNPSLTTDAIVMRNRSILLITRNNPPFESKLARPGGFVEYGEDQA